MNDRMEKHRRRMEAENNNNNTEDQVSGNSPRAENGNVAMNNTNSASSNSDNIQQKSSSASSSSSSSSSVSTKQRTNLSKKKKKTKRSTLFADSYVQQQKRENVVLNDAVNDPSSEIYKFLQTDKCLGLNRTFFYSLAIEPLQVRRERIIMLVEAYSIFGALFLNGTWFIWEYGSSRTFDNAVVEKIFEISCALDMIANILLTMFSGFLWVQCTMFSTGVNNPNWVWSCRHWLADMHLLQFLIFNFTIVSLCLGVHNRLEGGIDAWVVVCGTALVAFVYCQRGAYMWIEEIPLEYFHFPWYFKCMLLVPLIHKRKEIRGRAAKRAELLRKQVDKELQKAKVSAASHNYQVQQQQQQNPSPNPTSSSNYVASKNSIDDIESLLMDACQVLGRNVSEVDLTPYLIKLQEDWFDSVESLEDLDVNDLHNYMPLRLAQSTHALLLEKKKQT